MPVLRTYKGQPVYSRRQIKDGYRVKLIKLSPDLPRESFVVSAEDWKKHRRLECVSVS